MFKLKTRRWTWNQLNSQMPVHQDGCILPIIPMSIIPWGLIVGMGMGMRLDGVLDLKRNLVWLDWELKKRWNPGERGVNGRVLYLGLLILLRGIGIMGKGNHIEQVKEEGLRIREKTKSEATYCILINISNIRTTRYARIMGVITTTLRWV
jgi:hypothetical protein